MISRFARLTCLVKKATDANSAASFGSLVFVFLHVPALKLNDNRPILSISHNIDCNGLTGFSMCQAFDK
jgi:hypothetical protein